MIVSSAPLSPAWHWAGAVGALLGVMWAVTRAPWRSLQAPGLLNVWLGTVVVLSLIWQMRVQAETGLYLHFLGVTLLLLEVGPHLAALGIFAVLLVDAGNAAWQGDPVWSVLGVNGVLVGLLPVWLGWSWVRGVRRYAPRHLFVFIFANGFFGAGLTVVASGVLAGGLLAIAGAYPFQWLVNTYWPYLGLLGFAEAWLTGMVVTLFVVYRPLWLRAYDEQGFFGGR